MAFLKNTWYMAAWGDEVTREPMARTLLGESVLMYRREDGTPVAIHNRCPHRHAPLNQGKLIGDEIQCPYHGLRFNSTGACTNNPHGQHKIPPAMCVPAYTLAERDSILWIWMGAGSPDESLIPDFSVLTRPEHRTIRRLMTVDADYRLIADNILDLTHIVYVHKGIGGQQFLESESSATEQVGQQVWCRRRNEAITAAPAFRAVEPGYNTVKVDKHQNIRWDPPSNMLLEILHHESGNPRNLRTTNYGGNLLTPETEARTHYFWSVTRDYATENEALDEVIGSALRDAFVNEDKPIIEAQQAMMNLSGGNLPQPVLIETDAAAMRARRVLDTLMQSERSNATAH